MAPAVNPVIHAEARAASIQEGVVDEEAASKAREAGLEVIIDRCVMREYDHLLM